MREAIEGIIITGIELVASWKQVKKKKKNDNDNGDNDTNDSVADAACMLFARVQIFIFFCSNRSSSAARTVFLFCRRLLLPTL